jgi:hypothetical protein
MGILLITIAPWVSDRASRVYCRLLVFCSGKLTVFVSEIGQMLGCQIVSLVWSATPRQARLGQNRLESQWWKLRLAIARANSSMRLELNLKLSARPWVLIVAGAHVYM